MIAIKHYYTGETLSEFDVATIKEAAEKGKANLSNANLGNANLGNANLIGANLGSANLIGANLRGANLIGADLIGANLIGADLSGANLDDEKLTKSPLSVAGLRYRCLITDGYMRLGCKRFTHDEWAAFSDEQIAEMDDDALDFWKQWEDPLIAMCIAHSALGEEK